VSGFKLRNSYLFTSRIRFSRALTLWYFKNDGSLLDGAMLVGIDLSPYWVKQAETQRAAADGADREDSAERDGAERLVQRHSYSPGHQPSGVRSNRQVRLSTSIVLQSERTPSSTSARYRIRRPFCSGRPPPALKPLLGKSDKNHFHRAVGHPVATH
jgi:hypothetical protein